MPELTWIGKDKVVTHHNDVPFRILERMYSFDAINGVQTEDNGSENMIIHGDNLEALKALLPKYEGKIDCACCDSPYNTGNEAWVYNDNVNDPHIKKWLGEVVGKEGEDLSRHDKWLCMMYPRLKLIQKLLSKDGALVMCIGYQELSVLQIVLSEIFPTKQVVVITVKTTGGSKPTAGFSFTQDYLIFVVPKEFVPNKSKIMQSKTATAYHGMCLAGFNQVERPNQAYPIYIDIHGKLVGVGKTLQEKINDGEYTGQKEDYIFDYEEAPAGCVAVWPITSKGDACVWRLAPESFIKNYEKGYIKIFPAKDQRNKNKYVIQYLSDGIIKRIESGELKTHRASDVVPTIEVDGFSNSGESIPAIWDDNRFYTVHGKEEMAGIFGNKDAFSYPKPTAYITEILSRITDENSVVLDAFAGSGTVAHAVLELNKEDGGNRKFVIIELCDYAETVTAERVKRAIKGYDLPKTIRIYDEEISIKNIHLGEELLEQAAMAFEEAKDIYEKVYKPRVDAGHLIVEVLCKQKNSIPGTGGSFSFYELGDCLFDENGGVNPAAPLEEIRKYVWYSETRTPYAKPGDNAGYYLGENAGTGYYLAYEPGKETVLDYTFLAKIKIKADRYVIYADRCALSEEELNRFGITYKKTNRDIAKV